MRARAMVFSAPSGTVWELPRSLDALGEGLVVLKRRRFFARCVLGGAGALHPKLDESGRAWSAHLHLALDVAPGAELDLERVRGIWFQLTGGEVHDQPLRSAWGWCGYAMRAGRSKDYAPATGEMDLRRFALLLRGIHRRRLIVAWGTGRRGRRR